MFSKLFSKKKPFTKLETEVESFRFLGAPTGEGLQQLEAELSTVLVSEGNTKKAYLSKVQYPNEERIRVALVIDGKVGAEKMAPIIASGCQPITGIDIIFFESLNEALIQQVTQVLSPFYAEKNA